jgi:Flp pilus assembly protein TadG
MGHRQSTITSRSGRRLLGIDGAAAVELAITMSLLAVLVLGIADYGILMNDSAGLVAASRAGGEYAIANPTDTNGTETQVCGFFGLALNKGACAPVTPNATNFCTCVDNTVINCPWLNKPGNCAGVVNPYTNLTDTRILAYMTVTATQNFTPLIAVKNLGVIAPTTFGFPNTLTGTTVARTQ